MRAVNNRPARAEIALAFNAGTVTAKAAVIDARQAADAALYVAVYENGLSNQVTAGENYGVTLTHDYVVREWLGPFAFDGTTPVRGLASAHRYAPSGAAAFVQNRLTGEVLQATMCGG